MIKRVTFEEWQAIITLVAFIIMFGAFVYFTIRALRMSRRQRDHMANLPLQDEEPKHSNPDLKQR